MASLQTILKSAAKLETRTLWMGVRAMCTEAPKPPQPAEPKPAQAKPTPPTKPALEPASFNYVSAATPPAPSQPVGPGADKGGPYPNPEYFSYNKLSFYDLEMEMSSDRIKQPSADNGQF
ncbi:uncharacterized protein LOC127004401 [Eriocheir sinensis]|uniref:uncharacterized protein LOC127004401 n=1 Tax=Eriocheir sinensis TaxID=95602 RepID=UPI0021C69D6A|nr:uncharacterized protein LOC127004401 [Eriocheir sinensis]